MLPESQVGRTEKGSTSASCCGYPLQLVAVDILGPLPVTSGDNSYILLAEDYFT